MLRKIFGYKNKVKNAVSFFETCSKYKILNNGAT